MTIKKLHIANKIGFATLLFFSTFFIPQIYADLSVGDAYEGGTVFCVSQTPDIKQCVPQGSGKYGLIMANEDQVNFDSNPRHGVTWASKDKAVPGAQSEDDGAANTAAIIAATTRRLGKNDNPSNNAAWACHNYRGGGKEDWYLPAAKNELNKMYLYAKANGLIGKGCSGSKLGGIQCLIGGLDKDMEYWSSTECSGSNYRAWFQPFSSGGQYLADKVGRCRGVRAVRAFNHLTIQQFNYLPKPKSPQAVGLEVPLPPQVAVSAAALAAAPVQKPTAQVHTPQAVAAPVAAAPAPTVVPKAPAAPSPAAAPVVAPVTKKAAPTAVAPAVPSPAAPAYPADAAAASPVAPPARTDTDSRFTFGEGGEILARLGNLTRLYPPDYQLPTLIQALTDAGVPTPEEVVAHCNDVAACAVADGAVDCTRLTKEDAAAIAMYTFDFGGDDAAHNPYRLINGGLFERNALQLRRLRGVIYRLLHGLRSVQPVRPQALFRGIKDRVKLNDTHYHEGNKITWHSFSSTTTKMGVTQNFLTDPNTGKREGTLFIITGTPWGYNIQPFSCFPDEEEILLEPEVELRVTGVINAPLIVVNLEMLPDQRLLLENLIPRNIGGVVGLVSSPTVAVIAPAQRNRYIAQADWQSTIAGGLSFRRGDIINIIDERGHWWMGELNGQRGWVPPGYLRPEHSM